MKTKTILIALLALILALTGCSRKANAPTLSYSRTDNYADPAMYGADYVMYAAEEAYDAAPANRVEAKAASSSGSEEGQKRMVRKTASVTISVADPIQVMNSIIEMADTMGGFVVSSSNSQEYYTDGIYLPYADISIRVPSEKLNEALRIIESYTTDPEKYVKNKKITGTDITSEFVDTTSRLTSMEKTLTKLYEIMDTAQNAEEALEVYSEIANIESEIEVLKGQIKYMEESVALSSITIRVNSIKPEAVHVAAKWEPIEIIKDAFASLLEGGKTLIEVLIYVIIVGIPLLALLAIPIFLIVKLIKRIVRKGKNKKTSAKQAPEKTGETPTQD